MTHNVMIHKQKTVRSKSVLSNLSKDVGVAAFYQSMVAVVIVTKLSLQSDGNKKVKKKRIKKITLIYTDAQLQACYSMM